ncbi:receptor-like serine/threonine-protein kinase NCRK isoform X2 [Cucumis melo]|uniref:Receptor-like serine/threonine-protein kinase NCRK isoform X2 n=1 Tax=Cucumis melo TaxID=3656 RepID=A0ABM3LCC4_CUCME|nr:receptor-like serine/threonine-protein kinase NCRK isoform X2 [Cucumis melo]XP_050947691.1 receptor-like serine/threonine-protein kinase NCRK isoform X2 [Cucumis melo]
MSLCNQTVDKMKHQVAATFLSLVGFILLQQVICADTSDFSTSGNWTCRCFSPHQENQGLTLGANCSTSCSCTQDAEGTELWTCMCSTDGFPKVVADNRDSNCFTSCNCTYGLLPEFPYSKRHISSNVVVIILSLCVIIITLAFFILVVCYLCQRDKCRVRTPIISLDKQMSYNSLTNLISHKSSSTPDSKVMMDSPVNNIKGCFFMNQCLLRTKSRSLCGIIIQFSYSELENATEKFSSSHLVGRGGSSFVYRGELRDGRTVAVKRLNIQGGPDVDYLFLTEIQLLSRLNHCHVVPLVGYCTESRGKHTERLLVYEYMPKGNLRDCLDGASGEKMDWSTRVTIALGAARGLEYLHEAAAPRILHRDVKSTNILLDKDWRAKITDLGMATRLRGDDLPSCSSSPARMQGTFGYFAPEYAIVGRASLKSDVFSFGVVLLELITGQHPIHKSTGKGEESLAIWAAPRLQNSRRVITELPDPHLDGMFPEEEMQIMAYLAKECLLLDPDARPTMTEVVQVLSNITPDKSRRNNISANVFQERMSACSVESEPDIANHNMSPIGKQVHTEVIVMDEMMERQASSRKWLDRYSLPLDIDRSLCADNYGNQDIVSFENMKTLIPFTSMGNNLQVQATDDETVDLTEPRFESFCIMNVKSSS